MTARDLNDFITESIVQQVAHAGTVTGYRQPLVGFASAADPLFRQLRQIVEPAHYLPEELLPGARSVVSFFLPFAEWVVEANAVERGLVAPEWPTAYLETNTLIGRISARLIESLADQGIRAAAEPATHNYD